MSSNLISKISWYNFLLLYNLHGLGLLFPPCWQRCQLFNRLPPSNWSLVAGVPIFFMAGSNCRLHSIKCEACHQRRWLFLSRSAPRIPSLCAAASRGRIARSHSLRSPSGNVSWATNNYNTRPPCGCCSFWRFGSACFGAFLLHTRRSRRRSRQSGEQAAAAPATGGSSTNLGDHSAAAAREVFVAGVWRRRRRLKVG